jgi:hypothetical protein
MIKPRKSELVFEVTADINGGYVAERLTESIVTQGDDWDELRAHVRDTVQGYFYDGGMPDTIRLVRDDENVIASTERHAGPRWQHADFAVGCSTWSVWMR